MPSTSITQAAVSRRSGWSADEDAVLLQHIETHGASHWGILAKVLLEQTGKERTAKSCRLRWYNELHPSIDKSPLSEDEMLFIMQEVAQRGTRWSDIVRAMVAAGYPRRTDNCIKNTYHVKLKKRLEHETGRTHAEVQQLATRQRRSRQQKQEQKQQQQVDDEEGGCAAGAEAAAAYSDSQSNHNQPGVPSSSQLNILKDEGLNIIKDEGQGMTQGTLGLVQVEAPNMSTQEVFGTLSAVDPAMGGIAASCSLPANFNPMGITATLNGIVVTTDTTAAAATTTAQAGGVNSAVRAVWSMELDAPITSQPLQPTNQIPVPPPDRMLSLPLPLPLDGLLTDALSTPVRQAAGKRTFDDGEGNADRCSPDACAPNLVAVPPSPWQRRERKLDMPRAASLTTNLSLSFNALSTQAAPSPTPSRIGTRSRARMQLPTAPLAAAAEPMDGGCSPRMLRSPKRPCSESLEAPLLSPYSSANLSQFSLSPVDLRRSGSSTQKETFVLSGPPLSAQLPILKVEPLSLGNQAAGTGLLSQLQQQQQQLQQVKEEMPHSPSLAPTMTLRQLVQDCMGVPLTGSAGSARMDAQPSGMLHTSSSVHKATPSYTLPGGGYPTQGAPFLSLAGLPIGPASEASAGAYASFTSGSIFSGGGSMRASSRPASASSVDTLVPALLLAPAPGSATPVAGGAARTAGGVGLLSATPLANMMATTCVLAPNTACSGLTLQQHGQLKQEAGGSAQQIPFGVMVSNTEGAHCPHACMGWAQAGFEVAAELLGGAGDTSSATTSSTSTRATMVRVASTAAATSVESAMHMAATPDTTIGRTASMVEVSPFVPVKLHVPAAAPEANPTIRWGPPKQVVLHTQAVQQLRWGGQHLPETLSMPAPSKLQQLPNPGTQQTLGDTSGASASESCMIMDQDVWGCALQTDAAQEAVGGVGELWEAIMGLGGEGPGWQ